MRRFDDRFFEWQMLEGVLTADTTQIGSGSHYEFTAIEGVREVIGRRLSRLSKIAGEMVPHIRIEEAMGSVLGDFPGPAAGGRAGGPAS